MKAMAATLTDARFDDPDWIFERKLDGIRCLASTRPQPRLRSRNDLELNSRFPVVAEALTAQPDCVLDGEVVAFSGSRTSFQRLGQRGRNVFFYVFDILEAEGEDVREFPLLERKAILRRVLRPGGPVRLTPYRRSSGIALYHEACRRGWEGLIAKRADSPYVGKRSRDWLKWKCDMQQELVIGGYTAPKGSRIELGALLVGYWEDGRLRSATWVEPELVGQVGFTEWTCDGRLRHPRFLGLREDKDASEVVRERPS
jgi:bifunctional non-homologous end joining protein LigD